MFSQVTHYLSFLVIAQTRIEAINHGFVEERVEESSSSLIILVCSLVAAVLVAIAVWWFYQRHSMRIEDSAKRLFKELCTELELSSRQVRLLKELVKSRQLENPSEIFLRSELWRFDPTVDKKLCRLKTRNQLQILQRMLFSDPQTVSAD